jgi:hypothetical protein
MDQLFKALPRDLQWEVLTEFVGTHVVRNGKLMRKLKPNINSDQYNYTIRERPCYGWLYKRNNEELNRVFARFPSNGRMIMFCRDIDTNDTIYLYYKQILIHSIWEFVWEARFVPDQKEELIVSPIFNKNTYPSYPYTNKKLVRNNTLYTQSHI